MKPCDLIVHISNEQSDLMIRSDQVTTIVKEFISLEKIICHEVYINFVDTKTICQLHDDYFNDPTTTDCISFPIDPPGSSDYVVLGEIFVCPETAKTYATQHTLDPLREVALYIVHGLLHLIGYDDIGPSEPEMRLAEKRHMKNLDKKQLTLGH